MDEPSAPLLTRHHRSRLMQVWRSAGWPCKDGIEIDLLAAQLLSLHVANDGRESLKLTDAGIALLAEARQRGVRALTAHDRLARKFAEHLLANGRLVWRELSLRAQIEDAGASPPPTVTAVTALWNEDQAPPVPTPHVWRMARPDLFSVRQTSVAAYLQPMVHEVKFSRADLLSDLRHAAKRQAYEWLCSEAYYVFPAGVAQPKEIPEQFGVWVLNGSIEEGTFELLRPARHAPCTLPFAVWLALAKATPLRSEQEESVQVSLHPLQDAA